MEGVGATQITTFSSNRYADELIMFARCSAEHCGSKPATLPPGRARLAARPSPTGSPRLGQTMGMVVVACLAARAAPIVVAKMRSMLCYVKHLHGFCWHEMIRELGGAAELMQ